MNALGSIMQSQVSSNEKAKSDQARENQETYDSRQIARMTEQHKDEVEETEAADDVFVRREDEKRRDGDDARDTWDRHKAEKLYHLDDEESPEESSEEQSETPDDESDTEPPEEGSIIDLSV